MRPYFLMVGNAYQAGDGKITWGGYLNRHAWVHHRRETLQHGCVKFDWDYHLWIFIPVPFCHGGGKKKINNWHFPQFAHCCSSALRQWQCPAFSFKVLGHNRPETFLLQYKTGISSPSSEALEIDGVNALEGVSWCSAGGWTRWPVEIPSNPNHSVWFCDLSPLGTCLWSCLWLPPPWGLAELGGGLHCPATWPLNHPPKSLGHIAWASSLRWSLLVFACGTEQLHFQGPVLPYSSWSLQAQHRHCWPGCAARDLLAVGCNRLVVNPES